MGKSMSELGSQGQKVEGDLEKGAAVINDITSEAGGVADQLENIPGDLDQDLQQQVENARKAAIQEGTAEAEAQRADLIEKAKAEAQEIISDTDTKIQANNAMRSKLDSIASRFGKGARDSAGSAIDANTQQGENLKASLEQSARDAEQRVAASIDSLRSK